MPVVDELKIAQKQHSLGDTACLITKSVEGKSISYKCSCTDLPANASREIWLIVLCVRVHALLAAKQESGLPAVQPRHAVKLCNGICELVSITRLVSLCQVLHATPRSESMRLTVT